MSSAFNAFPAGAQIAGPPPRKTVEYGTGVVVSDDGAIIADRQITDGCLAVAIAGYGNADRVAEDKEHDLALLRIYGARGLKPLNLANAAAKTALDLTGIADPQSQGGGCCGQQRQGLGRAARRRQRCRAVAAAGARLFRRGRARRRRQIRRHRAVEAGAGGGSGECRAGGAGGAGDGRYRARFPQGQWRRTAAGGSADAKASVVRVICVRK